MSNSQNSSNYAAYKEEEEEEEEVDVDEVVKSSDSSITSLKVDAGDRANISRKTVAACLALRRPGLGQLEAEREIAKNYIDLVDPTSSSSEIQATWRKKNLPLLTHLSSLVPNIPIDLFDKMRGPKLANVILPMAEALQSWVYQNPDSPLPFDCVPLLDLFNL